MVHIQEFSDEIRPEWQKRFYHARNQFERVSSSEDDHYKISEPKERKRLLVNNCALCQKPILDSREVVALGKNWHSETCFQCTHCFCPLKITDFCDFQNQPYCEKDFNMLFRRKCYFCMKPIIEPPIEALGKVMHQLCLICCECGKQLSPNNFYEKQGKAYCEFDWHRLFSPKCGYCEEPVKDNNFVKEIGQIFHTNHFKCYICKVVLNPLNYKEVSGRAFCEEDYHQLYSPRCAECTHPIKEVPLEALGKKFHFEHFCCTYCKKVLSNDSFFEYGGNPYCKFDFYNLFGTKCKECNQPIEGDSIFALDCNFHPECFKCSDCAVVLNEKTFHEIGGVPFCQQHFHSRNCPDCIKIRRAQDKYFSTVVGEPKNTWKGSTLSLNLENLFANDFDQIRSNSSLF